MKNSAVSLEQMLFARERRAEIQSEMLRGKDGCGCLVCLTLNIAGEIKRTPMTRMLFGEGLDIMDGPGFDVLDSHIIDEITGSEAFWLLGDDADTVKAELEQAEESFPAARLFDFDVLRGDGSKLSRAVSRRCLICGRPAQECARSRNHGLDAIRGATDKLLREFCAERISGAAYMSLLDELYVTPKPGLVDLRNNGAHTDMDIPLLEKSAESLRQYFYDAALLGMNNCSMAELRSRGIEAERLMFETTCGVNTHKGMIYSMGLICAGTGMALASDECGNLLSEGIGNAARLARQDAEAQLAGSLNSPSTNGGRALRTYGAKGATGEAAAGFPDAVYCRERLHCYISSGCEHHGALALCDSMARLEDTNLLHRGGMQGLEYVRSEARRIKELPEDLRISELEALDDEMIKRGLSPGGNADMLALAFLLEKIAAFL